MELLGLAFIIVIILFGLLLVYRFAITKQQTNPTRTAMDDHLGSNLIDSMLDTSTSCRQMTVATLLGECAKASQWVCSEVQLPEGKTIPGGTECPFVTGVITYMLDSTLGLMQRRYEFEITDLGTAQDISITSSYGGCDAGFKRVERPRTYAQASTFTAVLKLCQ